MRVTRPSIGLIDAILQGRGFANALIVGLVIGAGIFETPALVEVNANSETDVLQAWGLGGAISIISAYWLTITTILGLLAIIIIGLTLPTGTSPAPATATATRAWGSAMVFVLLSDGGWNEAAQISAEIENYQRNIFRSRLWGLGKRLIWRISTSASESLMSR